MINTSIHQNKCTVEYYAFIREENVDDTQEHGWTFWEAYAKWNKPITNKISFHLYEVIQSNQIHRRDSKSFNRYGDSFARLKKVLWVDVGIGSTICM